MSNDLEERITKLEAEVERLSELVGRFEIGEVHGNLAITVQAGVQDLTVDTGQIGGDVAVTTKDVQSMVLDMGDIGNDVSVSANSVGEAHLDSGDVGNDVSVHTGSGSVTVNTGDVGGTAG